MKVLVLIPDLKRLGGVANYYRCLELDKNENIYYMTVNSFSTSHDYGSLILKIIQKISKILFLPFFYIRFLIAVPSYDIVHINPSLTFRSFYRDMLFIFISNILGKKTLIFFRGWSDEYENKIKKSKILTFLFMNSYASADSFIVLGEIFKNKLIGLGISPQKKYYLETTVADSRYLNSLDLNKKIESFDKNVRILFIARMLKDKGIYIAIDAFAKCKEGIKDRNITLFVAGDGEELENAKKYVTEREYENIVFLGYVKDDQKGDVMLNSHIMLFPTYTNEGLPNSILEGMLYGMPIISRVNAGIPDVIKNGVNGYLSESLDSVVFADYCKKIIEDKDLYVGIVEENHRKAKKLFTTEAVRKRLIDIYNEQDQ